MSDRNLPNNKKLPFFAYGIFKPGQIAFSRIEPFIDDEPIFYKINHQMYLRDGVPFTSPDERNYPTTDGYLIEFKENKADDAYDIIGEVGSDKLYYWKEINVGDKLANVLIGRSPNKSRPENIGDSFDGKNDPLFNEALELIQAEMEDFKYSHNLKDYFKIQRNYILLWSAIERYTSLKYGNNLNVSNNKKLSDEEIFQNSLRTHLNPNRIRHIYRTDTLKKITLNSQYPKDSIDYYYTIRCNIVHRGKSVYSDRKLF